MELCKQRNKLQRMYVVLKNLSQSSKEGEEFSKK